MLTFCPVFSRSKKAESLSVSLRCLYALPFFGTVEFNSSLCFSKNSDGKAKASSVSVVPRITTPFSPSLMNLAMVTSDRIVVMNRGRIDQIDAPHVLYGRPKSRFVAGFIGRTNFVEKDGGTYSLRPQSIGLSATKPAANGVEAEIESRAYLGEYWDYQVKPLGGTKPLRVSTAPTEIFEAGQRVWLEIDPAAMVRVE